MNLLLQYIVDVELVVLVREWRGVTRGCLDSDPYPYPQNPYPSTRGCTRVRVYKAPGRG